MQRAQEVHERRHDDRRKPLPEQAQVTVSIVRARETDVIQAEVLDVSPTGMRLAAFAHSLIQKEDRCEISTFGDDELGHAAMHRWATVRWVNQHPMIQVFGVLFD